MFRTEADPGDVGSQGRSALPPTLLHAVDELEADPVITGVLDAAGDGVARQRLMQMIEAHGHRIVRIAVKAGDQAKEGDCQVRMQRFGNLLLVEDNGACGGIMVTFTGFYRRKP